MTEPLVSVIMAARNEELYILDAIKSIQSQTHQNFELIVIDDGSTDGTIGIVERIKQADQRVILLRGNREGPAAARSMGINASRGEYIMIMDADDVSEKQRIEKLLSLIENNSKVMIGSNVALMKTTGEIVGKITYPETNNSIRAGFNRRWNRSVMMPGTILASRELHLSYPYNRNLQFLEDWDFVLRVSEDPAVTFSNHPEQLYHYRLKPNSVSMNWRSRNRYNIMIWYNERRRKANAIEVPDLASFEAEINSRFWGRVVYNMLLAAKFVQHNIWRFRMKKLLGI